MCYLLIPEGLKTELGKWAESAAARFHINIVLITGIDWNRDMSPWPAEGVMKARKPFLGGAKGYLKKLTGELIPEVEHNLSLTDAKRYLIGVSLSGLFAVWSISESTCFEGVSSVSGSLWYDGFSEWIKTVTPAGKPRIYMSLGVKEKNASDTRMATVEDATVSIAETLKSKGLDLLFEMVPGTHFSPLPPKLDRALEALLS